MNRKMIKEVGSLPYRTLEKFAQECGVEWVDPNGLLELQAIFLEEIVENDVDASNIFSAFKEVQDKVSRRWNDWVQDSVSCTYDV